MNVNALMQAVMPQGALLLVEAVVETAVSHSMPVYLVGGVVRDLYLGKMATDLDFVVEGSGIELAEAVAARFGGAVVPHKAFGTAVWTVDEVVWTAVFAARQQEAAPLSQITTIDFVTARKERYAAPATLPIVTPSHIQDDLARRDFTINTLATRLDGETAGQLIDPFGGLHDLIEANRVRVLHNRSFIDDPTRIFRAVRYATRLGLTLDDETERLLLAARPFIQQTTGARLWHELALGFCEQNPRAFMAELARLGVLAHVVDGLDWLEKTAVSFQTATNQLANHPFIQPSHCAAVYLTIWLLTLPEGVETAVYARFALPNQLTKQIDQARQSYKTIQQLPASAKPSQIVPHLERLQPWARFALRCLLVQPYQQAWLTQYEQQWRFVLPTVDGEQLIALGLTPGPQFGMILDRLKAAWLDGEISNKMEEQMLLQQLLAGN